MNQARVEVIKEVVFSVVVLCVLFFYWKWYDKTFVKNNKFKGEEIETGAAVVGVIISVILTFFLFSSYNNAMDAFFNPEYWAWKHMFKQ